MTPVRRHNFANIRSRRAAYGFTLLELVLALSMVVIVAGSLYASMRAAFKAKSTAETSIEPARTAELAMDLLRNDLLNAVAPNPNTQNAVVLAGPFTGQTGSDDRGQPDSDLIFCTTAEGPQHLYGDGDIRQVELNVITTDNNEHVLVRRVTSNLLSNISIDPEDEVLCRGVSSFSLSYYNGSDWSDIWDSRDQDNTLPTAVQVTLELERPGGIINSQGVSVLRFVRVFAIPCSTAATDTNLSSTGGL